MYSEGADGLRIPPVSESVALAALSQCFVDTVFKTMTVCHLATSLQPLHLNWAAS